MSQITTHILDTARGCPAEGVTIRLYAAINDGWKELFLRMDVKNPNSGRMGVVKMRTV